VTDSFLQLSFKQTDKFKVGRDMLVKN